MKHLVKLIKGRQVRKYTVVLEMKEETALLLPWTSKG